MEEHLFANFLHNCQEYQQAEKFWQDHWLQLVQESGQKDFWKTPWVNTSFADGTPIQDGNPIFSAIRSDGRMRVRVIQLDPAEAAEDFSYWQEEYATEEAQKGDELVVCCALTRRTASKAIDTIKGFIEPGDRARVPA